MYKHNLIKYTNHKDSNEDVRNIKAELDVLKNTIKSLISITEEGRILYKNVVSLKEDIMLILATIRSELATVQGPGLRNRNVGSKRRY